MAVNADQMAIARARSAPSKVSVMIANVVGMMKAAPAAHHHARAQQERGRSLPAPRGSNRRRSPPNPPAAPFAAVSIADGAGRKQQAGEDDDVDV